MLHEIPEDIRKAAAVLMVNLRYSATETQAQGIAEAALLAERMAERERCAKIIDGYWSTSDLAAAIRNQDKP
ncbi:MAG TPA: hypothetical protein VJL90_12795 [Pseudorhodoplanes sp.]|nr:hypothetical protein [Pseudorhodoplanes sp.]